METVFPFFIRARKVPGVSLALPLQLMSFIRSLSLITSVAALTASGAPPASNTKEAPARLELHKWSGDINVPDPVACTVDPQGRVYVTQTTRRKVGDLDIREHTQWIPADVALDDIENKIAFYHDVLAPGKMLRPEGSLKDHNKDGSIDWKDLTVHSERIYRLEDTDGDGTADKKTLFAEGFNTEVTGIAAGILWHDGWIYTTIAPDLWRLRDTNDDGVADEREAIVHGFGHHIAYAGHDMHGLCIGPDGRIYWSIGDKGVNVLTKEGRRVAQPHQGAVLRCEPDGSNFEIFAHGLRNVQEIAFDDYGNLFGVDNDSDRPGEKERFVYITELSDSGWRNGYQYMKGYVPWMDEFLSVPQVAGQPAYITPPLALAHDGPAGFAYNPGTALSKAWRGAFFGNQFPSGKMNAFRVVPSGASFSVTQDTLVTSGVMGIGLSWAPNGKLFMADWGGDYPLNEIGAVWSVDDASAKGDPARADTERLLTQGFSDVDAVQPLAYLAHEDQRVRRAAQFESVKRGDFSQLQKIAANAGQPQLAKIHALWGLGQGMRAGSHTPPPEFIHAMLADKDAELRAQTAKVLGDAPAAASFGEKLIPLLSDESARVRFQTAIALGKLKVPAATDALLELARESSATDRYLFHAATMGITGCANEAALLKAVASPERNIRLATVIAFRRLRHADIMVLLHDRDDVVAAEAARAVHDDESIPKALPELASLLDIKRSWPDAVARRSLNAGFRLGDKAAAARVVRYALLPDASLPLREEALNLVKMWGAPTTLDRVDGVSRILGDHPAKGTPDEALLRRDVMAEIARPHIEGLMALKEPTLKPLAVQILLDYKLPVTAPIAAAAVLDQSTPAEIRVEVLRLLADQHAGSPELGETLAVLLKSKSPSLLRAEALQTLLVEDPEKAVAESRKMLASGSTFEKQKAFSVLAAVKLPAADDVLVSQMKLYATDDVQPPVQLDLLEAAQQRSADVPALAAALSALETKRAPLAGTAKAFSECLDGGDIKSGRDIALNNLTANCSACHIFESKEGSSVGPVLTSIGAGKDRAYLLEALVAPNAHIASGFGVVSLTLKNGETLTGSLLKSDDKGIQVRLADGSEKTFTAAEITSKTDPVSVMPPMNLMLTKSQIRDVVSYLASLTGSKGKPKAAPAKTKPEPEG